MDAMESTRELANAGTEESCIRETIAKAMVDTEAMINAAIEDIKVG